MNYDYPEASYERRKEINLEHENYQKGYSTTCATINECPQMCVKHIAGGDLQKTNSWIMAIGPDSFTSENPEEWLVYL